MNENIYEIKLKEALKENKKNFLNTLNEKETIEKIEKYALENDYSVNYIIQKLHEEPLLIDLFVKNPTKQGIHEKIAYDILSKIDDFKNVDLLPKRGNSSLYITNGIIINGKELTTKEKTKSIDFYFEYKDYSVYATHKYTKESGGSQDNQFNDVKYFLENAIKNTVKNNIFVAIVDGEYYTEKKADNTTKKDELLLKTKNTNCIVTDIYNIKKDLDTYIENIEKNK